ncbi:Bifunctional purine biosynthesis protein PurH OS=Streptomyces alboniger OX=132473 GN=purH PE=3 SV=1 [Streptomyces alboniger]
MVTSPARYADVLAAVQDGGFDLATRKRLAAEAFRHTAEYDIAVSSWFASAYAPADDSPFPSFLATSLERSHTLRYGENPHQPAALYTAGTGGLAEAEQLHGKEMSFNNFTDTDAARRAAYDHAEPAVAIIKHANPCGIAVGADVAEAHRKAHACDPLSAFGGVIAVNRPVSKEMAEQVAEIFTEVIVAPDYEDGALEALAKKKNIRVLRVPDGPAHPVDVKPIDGGALLQVADRLQAEGDDPANWTLATGEALGADGVGAAVLRLEGLPRREVQRDPPRQGRRLSRCRHGAGRPRRLREAGRRAGGRRARRRGRRRVDAFFPFPDGLEILVEAGVKAVVQPGGSVRDELVVEAAKKAGVTMYFTGTRHFFH